MNQTIAQRRRLVALSALMLLPLSAHAQTTLTGAIEFATNSNGVFGGDVWNTHSGDGAWDLWMALNPDATLPVNGPTDAQAGISIPLKAGHTYKYYIFTEPDLPISFSGLNLFFDNNNSVPGISVYGPLNSAGFLPNASSTLTLEDTAAAGSGTSFHIAGGVVAVLTGYNFNSPATPPGDVCYIDSFTPGGGPDLNGSFTLQVFPAAALTLGQSNGAPGTSIPVAGSGFVAGETVVIFTGQLGSPPVTSAVADASGSFTVTAREPQYPYGPNDFYALGRASGKLGAAPFSVEPALAATPGTAEPGSTVALQGVGFGAGETVSVYWNNPRILVGTTVANGTGSFTGHAALNIAIPSNAAPGLNILVGIGQSTNAFGIGEILVQ